MVVRIIISYYLDRIQLTMELWEKDALMSSGVNVSFEHGRLILEIILLTETGHAIICVFNGAYQ